MFINILLLIAIPTWNSSIIFPQLTLNMFSWWPVLLPK